MDRETVLGVQLLANTFLAIGIIVAGIWADRTSARRVLSWGALATVVLGFVFGPVLGSASLPVVFVMLSVSLFIMGLVYGPLGAWLPTLFPPFVRYTGVSVAFNAGGIVGGAVVAVEAQRIAMAGGIALIGLFLTAAGLATLAGVWAARPWSGGTDALPESP